MSHPWGQLSEAAFTLTINTLATLMMLLLLLHQHVSYGCLELKHAHKITHLLSQKMLFFQHLLT